MIPRLRRTMAKERGCCAGCGGVYLYPQEPFTHYPVGDGPCLRLIKQ